jgi:hypothetical protein
MLFTAYHGSAAPTGPWRGIIAALGDQMIWRNNSELSKTTAKVIVNQVGSPQVGDPTQVTGYYTHLGSCHGPAGGAPSAGVGGGVPAERKKAAVGAVMGAPAGVHSTHPAVPLHATAPPPRTAALQRASRGQLGRISRHLSGSIFNPPSGIFGFYFKGPAF